MPTTIAIIPAAGSGSRFSATGPKALVPLLGRPLVVHALERLFATGRVGRAVVAAPAESLGAFAAAVAGLSRPVEIVRGGASRRESVAAAVRAARADPDDLLCVHDAARPLIDPNDAAAVIDAAAASGAAVAGFAMVETVKRVAGKSILETVARRDLAAATTPQVFRASLLLAALDTALDVTDDSELVERAGGTVALVPTSRWNIKVTYPEDLLWAEAYLLHRAEAVAR